MKYYVNVFLKCISTTVFAKKKGGWRLKKVG